MNDDALPDAGMQDCKGKELFKQVFFFFFFFFFLHKSVVQNCRWLAYSADGTTDLLALATRHTREPIS